MRTATAIPTPSVSVEYFDQLLKISEGDTLFVVDQIEAFIEKSRGMIKNLHTSLYKGDFFAYAAHSHALATSAGTIGATPLRLLCLAGELSAVSEDEHFLQRNSRKIAEELAMVTEILQAQINLIKIQ